MIKLNKNTAYLYGHNDSIASKNGLQSNQRDYPSPRPTKQSTTKVKVPKASVDKNPKVAIILKMSLQPNPNSIADRQFFFSLCSFRFFDPHKQK